MPRLIITNAQPILTAILYGNPRVQVADWIGTSSLTVSQWATGERQPGEQWADGFRRAMRLAQKDVPDFVQLSLPPLDIGENTRHSSRQSWAETWLKRRLADPQASKVSRDIIDDALAQKLSRASIYRAARELKVEATVTGEGRARSSVWSLPSSKRRTDPPPLARDDMPSADDTLRAELSRGSRAGSLVMRTLKAEGFTREQVWDAAERLGVVKKRMNDGSSLWSLPREG